MNNPTNYNRQIYFILVPLILFGAELIVYWPGLWGPFVFDDYTNIVRNSFLRIDNLTASSLVQAALSSESGPLGRPLPMLTFALNAYAAGGMSETFAFKLTNLFIHWLNGLLVFVFTHKLVTIIYGNQPLLPGSKAAISRSNSALIAATAVSLIWLLNPIQLTSVLYVVQRMTSLSATFVLLALVSYLHGRQLKMSGKPSVLYLWFFPALCTMLGIFSKENAILLPFLVIATEFVLFPDAPILSVWPRFYNQYKKQIITVALVALLSLFVLIITYSLPGYENRSFTMIERLLTETRILIFYISLILVPRINAFGLHHDDIAISHSLFDPWSTFIAVLLLIGGFVFAWRSRRRWPLASYGFLFFLTGHALESTFLPLELAHEHRNYLPSFGIILLVAQFMLSTNKKELKKLAGLILTLLFIISAGTTYIRSGQWADIRSLVTFEAIHHPDSPRAQIELSGMLEYFGERAGAIEAARNASDLDPQNPGYLIELQMLAASSGRPDPGLDEKIVQLLATQPQSAFLRTQLRSSVKCMKSKCPNIHSSLELWLKTLSKRVKTGKNASYYNYLLGQTYLYTGQIDLAVRALELSAMQDPAYAHPLFLLASVYVQKGNVDEAEKVHTAIKNLNRRSELKWEKELTIFSSDLEKLKKKEENR